MTSVVEVYKRWPTPEAAAAHLEAVRWPTGPICPYCGAERVSRHRETGRERWQCQRCHKSFSVTVGTIFHNSHIDLQRWFSLIALMLSAKKGLSACQAARDLDMRRPTVWSMMHRVRRAMVDDGQLLAGLVEMDETYVGGKPRKRNRRDDDPPGGQGVTSKVPVVGAAERGGRVKVEVSSKEEMAAGGLDAMARRMIRPAGTVLTTDEHPGYGRISRFVSHRTINHSVSYVERDLFSDQFGAIHTNTIEGFWAIVKRAIYGQFHHVSRKYLPLYLREIVYRFNQRRHKDDGFHGALSLAVKP